jgi:peroxiredoxin
MRNWMLSAAMAVVVAIAFVSFTNAGDKDKYKDKGMAAAVGQSAPAFSLPDQAGKTVSLADFSDKIVVIEWFNDECPYVVAHYRNGAMNTTASKFAEKDVVWVAINSTKGKSNEDNAPIATEWKIERPILNDSSGQVGRLYGAKTTPHMFVIDKTGVIVYAGAIDNQSKDSNVNYVDKALTELLAGNSVSEPQTKPYGCSVKYAK